MATVLSPAAVARAFADLAGAEELAEPPARRPVHTVYGGAHLFRHDAAEKLGRVALATLDRYAPDAITFARAFELPADDARPSSRGAASLAETVRERVAEKLRREPIEDYRIDFEDGYGTRTEDEEDAHAEAVGRELAEGLAKRTLPPFVGVRIKALAPATRARAARTLDLVVSTAVRAGGGLPPWFAVTLPKVTHPREVAALASLLDELERSLALPLGSVRVEAMIETPSALLGEDGRVPLAALVEAGRGRCSSLHLGAYDLTASLDVVAPRDALRHPACDLARVLLKLSIVGTGVEVSDGATTELPIAPHRGAALSPREEDENRAAVWRGWQRAFRDVGHALSLGIYQGWDLHPAQLVSRYAAVYAHFLGALDDTGERLASFVAQAAQARARGAHFDDAATGQALLAFFSRAVAAGAITEDDAARRTGVTLREIHARSFAAIVRSRA